MIDDALDFEVLIGEPAVAAAAASAAGCFQQAEWVRAVACARGRPHAFVVVRASRHGAGLALLPGGVHRRWGVPVFEAMPMGGYGGWLGAAALTVEEELRLNLLWLRRSPWPLVEITSLPGREQALPRQPSQRLGPQRLRERLASRLFVTQLLDLSGDEETMLRRTRPSVRSYLRKVDGLGFSFERGTDAAALSSLHRWYRQGSAQWRQAPSSLLPEAFFSALMRPGYAEVWTVHFRGREVAAALFLLGRDGVQYQASGSERVESTLSATEAVVWAAANHYRQRGSTTMNLGASDGLDSVARFKKKFGAQEVAYLRSTYLLPRLLAARTAG